MDLQETIDTKRWQKNAGILKESKIIESIDPTAIALGLATSSLLTSIMVVYGQKARKLFTQFPGNVAELFQNLEQNLLHIDHEERTELAAMIKAVAGRFLHDPKMIEYFKKIQHYSGHPDDYSIQQNKILMSEMEAYISGKLNGEEKKFVKEINKYLTGSF